LIHDLQISDEYFQFELTDGRLLFVPLWWIPSVYNAAPEDRRKFTISRDRKMVIWDPDECSINDELGIDDFLGTRPKGN
jgi:hypothetical protein